MSKYVNVTRTRLCRNDSRSALAMPACYVLHQRPGFCCSSDSCHQSQSGTWAPSSSQLLREKASQRGRERHDWILNQQLKSLYDVLYCFTQWLHINKLYKCSQLISVNCLFLPIRNFFWEYWNHQNTKSARSDNTKAMQNHCHRHLFGRPLIENYFISTLCM